MKLLIIIVLLALSAMVNGSWWAAAAQPIILSIGALFAALDMDLEPMLDAQPTEWSKLMGFKYDG